MKDLRGGYAILAIAKEKPEKKNSGFSGIRTRDLCDTGAVLYHTELWSHNCWEQVIFFQASLSQLLKLRIHREDLS